MAAQAALIGKLDSFDDTVEDWSSYIERADEYFALNSLPEEKKVAAIITSMGAKTYAILRKLTTPNKPSEKTYADIKKYLGDYFSPVPLEMSERHRFYKRLQREGESANEYMAELRRLSQNCNFGSFLDQALRDKFVCGLRYVQVQQRLLTAKKVTLEHALDEAVAHELAVKDIAEFKSREEVPASVAHVEKEARRCYRCDRKGHPPSKCKFLTSVCHKCNKVGHISTACKSKSSDANRAPRRSSLTYKNRQASKSQVHAIEQDSDAFELLAHVDDGNKSSPIWLKPQIEGHTLEMEMDTGSKYSLVPRTTYEAHLSHLPLEGTSVRFKTLTGQAFSPNGVATANVTFGKSTQRVQFFVVDTPGPPLFGRDWINRFNLLELSSVLRIDNQLGPRADQLNKILAEHRDVFDDSIGKLKHIKLKLRLQSGVQPKFCRPRQVPYALKEKVNTELERLEAVGILTKVNHSDWATPIVPVVKANGTVRICGDFKTTINPHLVVDQYPLPRIEDIFAKLAGGQKFSKIDLRQAYLQMEVDDESKPLLTINTEKGLYQYNRMIFGISPAPAVWQRTIDQILQGIPMCHATQDDILVTGESEDSHLKNLELVLRRLQEYGLRANLQKCSFFEDSVTYCGYKLDGTGLHKTEDKIKAVIRAPTPKSTSELRSFLGLVNYYGKFIPDSANLLRPLHALLEKSSPWKWTKECEVAFQQAKKIIASETVLVYYNPNLEVRLACDAGPHGLGAVLSHKMPNGSERPIAFASRTLKASEKQYSQIDKEALAIVWGIQKFYAYLYGRHFKLITDHQPLTHIFGPTSSVPAMQAARIQRYALFLAGLDYEIQYRKSSDNANADTLSRLPLPDSPEDKPDEAELFYLNQMEQLPVTAHQVRQATERDRLLSRVRYHVLNGWDSCKQDNEILPFYRRRDELSLHHGIIVWGIRTVIPAVLRETVLNDLHSGHQGTVKMKALARSFVWWPSVDTDIEAITKKCAGCSSESNMPPKVSLHPWEVPSGPWRRVHLDFAGPFLGKMFLIAVDSFSKWPEIHVMSSTTAECTVDALRVMFASHGIPERIVTDNGPQFTSEELRTFLMQNGVRHTFSAPYHPATNGLAERFVQSFKHSMKAMKGEGSIIKKLTNFLLAYRTTPHCATGETPANLYLGRELRTRLALLRPQPGGRTYEKQGSSQPSKPQRSFSEGEEVSVRSYRGTSKWVPGTIATRTGPLSYEVEVGGTTWKRHTDQLRKGHTDDKRHLDPEPEFLPSMQTSPDNETSPACVPDENKSASPRRDPCVSAPEDKLNTPRVAVPVSLPDPITGRPVRVRRPPSKLDL